MSDEEGGSDSSADWEADWDGLERDTMKALDERLAALDAEQTAEAGASKTQDVDSNPLHGFLPPQLEDMRQLQELCSKEPYRPEDHVLTNEEMWAGYSSEEGDADEPTLEEPEPAAGAARAGAPCPAPAEAASSAGPSSSRYAEIFADTATAAAAASASTSASAAARETLSAVPRGRSAVQPAKQPQMLRPCVGDFEMDSLVDAGRLLEDACRHEPYRPEDHQLTAEEFWGGSSGSSDNGDRQALPQARQEGVDDPQHLTADEMWGDWSDDNEADEGAGGRKRAQQPAVVPPATLAAAPSAAAVASCPAVARVVRFSGETSRLTPDDRLQRVLAGSDAATVLAGLSFEELGDVANDCLRAVDTLRWVLDRQRVLAQDRSGGDGR